MSKNYKITPDSYGCKFEYWETDDGRRFDNKKEAEIHEESLNKAKNKYYDLLEELKKTYEDAFGKPFDSDWDKDYSKGIVDQLNDYNLGRDSSGSDNRFWSNPCKNCSNNPAVNPMASGVCFCILGSPVIY